jgi:outer membrane protein assembly factor BamB
MRSVLTKRVSPSDDFVPHGSLADKRPLLRFVPLAVLSAIVVAAGVARRAPIDRSRNAGPHASATSTAAPFASNDDAGARSSANVPQGAPRMLHGSSQRTHRSEARGPRAAKIGWQVHLDGPVASQVTTSADEATLYASTLGGSVVALARADGTRLWSSNLGDRVYTAPLVDSEGRVFVGTDAKKFVALSPKGESVFRLDLDGEADTSATFAKDGTILFAAGKTVYDVRRSGDMVWRFSAKKKVFTAPAVTDDGLVIVGSQDHRVYAIAPSGALAWSVDLGADVDGAPAVGDDGSIYVGTDAGEVVKVEEKGVAWRARVSGFVRGPLSIARNGDVVVGTYGPVPHVVRVSPAGLVREIFAIRGTGAAEFGIHGGPVEDADGNLYFGAQDDAVYAVDPSGALRWRFETHGDVDGPLTLLSDGALVVASEDGTVTLLLP